MKIPDCYEGYRQEEERQRAWDEYMEKLPICCICGKRVRENEPYHTSINKSVCFSCFDELLENETLCEVEW